jgi:exonuclease III
MVARVLMARRNWLDWNVRGLNYKDKRLAVYNKIDESNCSVVCIQETKCESFEAFLQKIC